MTYNSKKLDLFLELDKTIRNNIFYFDLYDTGRYFYDIYRNTHMLLGLKYNIVFIEISILFEFLLKNYDIFCNLIDGNSNKEDIDILCFLNVNIYIIKKLINLMENFLDSRCLIQEIINLNKDYFDKYENGTNNMVFKKALVDIFNKIIHSEINPSKNT